MKSRSFLLNRIRIRQLVLFGLLIIACSCNNTSSLKEEFYTEADFKTINKIDVHCHVNTKRPAFMEQAVEDNFRILTINTESSIGTIEGQQDSAHFQQKAFPGRLAYLTTFSMEGWCEDGWTEKAITYLKESFRKGAIGVKVWKNIGMVEKNEDGEFIMINDPKFDPIFSYLQEEGIPVCGHLGEPKNCWLPLDEMTVNNDKRYFKNHPEYHMYLHPEYPSYEDQIMARNNLLEKFPDLKFLGAHFGSLEWSVDEMAKHFDRFPKMTVDMAARMCHIQKQAQTDWQKVHEFFIKYQDRILYGTDGGDYGKRVKSDKLKENTHRGWKRDWKFLTTNETLTSGDIEGEFKGLLLPKSVIDKIYYKNAENLFPEFKIN